MSSLLNLALVTIAAPFSLLMPVMGQGAVDLGAEGQSDASSSPDYEQPPEELEVSSDTATRPMGAFYNGQTIMQVRIEQRVIFRITPRRQSNRNALLARLPQRGLTTQFEEREMDRCVPMDGIAGVQTGNGNRLLLFLRDERIVTINLERACRARDFYSGFYLEGSEDGMLCVERDQLQSRSGAKCEIERMRQLVAVEG